MKKTKWKRIYKNLPDSEWDRITIKELANIAEQLADEYGEDIELVLMEGWCALYWGVLLPEENDD